jgi:hypothetical protein
LVCRALRLFLRARRAQSKETAGQKAEEAKESAQQAGAAAQEHAQGVGEVWARA